LIKASHAFRFFRPTVRLSSEPTGPDADTLQSGDPVEKAGDSDFDLFAQGASGMKRVGGPLPTGGRAVLVNFSALFSQVFLSEICKLAK
jgi:hypothetical protein